MREREESGVVLKCLRNCKDDATCTEIWKSGGKIILIGGSGRGGVYILLKGAGKQTNKQVNKPTIWCKRYGEK